MYTGFQSSSSSTLSRPLDLPSVSPLLSRSLFTHPTDTAGIATTLLMFNRFCLNMLSANRRDVRNRTFRIRQRGSATAAAAPDVDDGAAAEDFGESFSPPASSSTPASPSAAPFPPSCPSPSTGEAAAATTHSSTLVSPLNLCSRRAVLRPPDSPSSAPHTLLSPSLPPPLPPPPAPTPSSSTPSTSAAFSSPSAPTFASSSFNPDFTLVSRSWAAACQAEPPPNTLLHNCWGRGAAQSRRSDGDVAATLQIGRANGGTSGVALPSSLSASAAASAAAASTTSASSSPIRVRRVRRCSGRAATATALPVRPLAPPPPGGPRPPPPQTSKSMRPLSPAPNAVVGGRRSASDRAAAAANAPVKKGCSCAVM